MDIEEIKQLVDDAEVKTSTTRDEASDMLVFGRISQWDDDVAADVLTEFRGTFDLIKQKRNRILSEMWANPVSIEFKANDGADEDAAETLTGMFRTDMQRSDEAIETAQQDQLDCGFGAFRFTTEYESKWDDLNNHQRITVEPIDEANNVVFFDGNAKRKDKSDAIWGMIITTYTEKGWERYAQEQGFDEKLPTSFKTPNKSDSWFWRSKGDEVKIGEFYYKEKKREKVLLFQDPLGQIKAVYKREVQSVLDELIDAGFMKIGEKMKDRWVVYKCIVTGEDKLKTQRIPGEHIPIVPVYGDWSRTEGRELWRGIYHDAQDPQRLHNTLMSYFVDIVAKGPREKPIFYPGQIQGYEFMYSQTGAEDNYPYRLVNEVSQKTGQPYPPSPVGYMQNPEIPQSLVALMGQARQSVDEITGGMLDKQQMLSGQVTDDQIQSVRAIQNIETFLYQNNFQLAMKQAGRIYASMASELYDVPREVKVTSPDGTESEAMIMETIMDQETGELVTINDLTKGSFEVYSDTGPSFQSQKEAARTEMREMYQSLAGTPEGELVLLTYFTLMDGPKTEHLRDYARRQLILKGIIEPETDEEKAMMQQAAQQDQQPDPMMIAAMAESMKAQADMMDAQVKQASVQVDAYKAETDRAEAMADIGKKRAEIQKLGFEIQGTELDNVQKLQRAIMPRTMRMQ